MSKLTKLLMPDNIFSVLFASVLPEQLKNNVRFTTSSVISTEIENGNADAGIIPSCDLLKHKDFFVSSKLAFSFDGQLSGSYLYFIAGQNNFTDLYLTGDVNSNDVILSKIVFNERYSSQIQIHLANEFDTGKNFLLAGDKNFEKGKFSGGLSFADELSTMLFLPYVNFILVSNNESSLTSMNKLFDGIDEKIENNCNEVINKLNLDLASKDFINDNFNSLYYEMTENETDALTELIRLPYYHGITEELFDLKFV